MSKLLGSSPLGLAFFSTLNRVEGSGTPDPQTAKNFVKPHAEYTQAEVNERIGEDMARSGTTVSTGFTAPGETEVKELTLDYGLGYQTFGDKRTIFTDNKKMPRTFYVYYNRDKEFKSARGDKISMVDYIKSTDPTYYNSNYIDQNSSITKIIDTLDKLTGEKGTPLEGNTFDSIKLKYSDFAYLKNLGVYPSNRLIVARRFAIGVGDDLLSYKGAPLSVIPSWIEDGKSFVDISFGEDWIETLSTDVAQGTGNLASEFNISEGSVAEKLKTGAGIFALPGFTEWLQYYLFERIGITDAKNLNLLPTGNPNIIRKSKTRSTMEDGAAFSGLSYKFSIAINNEYEIKYIDGVDPTLVYFDIISNLLHFGTSESQFQFDARFNQKAREQLDKLASGDFDEVMKALGGLLGGLVQTAKRIGETVKDFVLGTLETTPGGNRTQALLSSQIKKYRIKFIGYINALTGNPSGIYHVTVGNPLRPLFASGDLVPGENKGMSLTLGSELGYNNLPTSIKFSCTLTNARPCGLQEIYKKFSPAPVRLSTDSGIVNVSNEQENNSNILLNTSVNRPRTTTSSPTIPNFLNF